MTSRVCVVGSFMMDLVASAPRRPTPGETLVGTAFAMHVGGKGFNQAVAAARAGAATSMVGMVGGDVFGTTFRSALVAEGISHDHVVVDDSVGTGVGLPVVEPDGQNSIIVVPRANLRVDAELVAKAGPVIAAADVLLLQLELPIDTAVMAARVARAAGTTVILNPAPMASLPAELLERVDILVPNEVELGALLGRPTDDVRAAARALHARWCIPVVVTCGCRGAVVIEPDGRVERIPGRAVTAVDTVGAGDTFCGYLGAGLAAGEPLVTAARRANIAAGVAVTRWGSAEAVPDRREVDAVAEGGQPPRRRTGPSGGPHRP